MKISVITTTYNQKEFLRETIASVAHSILTPYTNIDIEHLIYDDASTDGTAELFTTDAMDTFTHITYVRGEKNSGGPSLGRNILMQQARGDYIFMIDHDDILLSRTLYNFANIAHTHPDRTWFISDFARIDTQGRYMVGEDYYAWDFLTTEDMLRAIFKGECFIQSSVFFKKSLFQETGGFDESRPIDQDLDLFIRFLLNGHIPLRCPWISHFHRFHNNNLSGQIDQKRHGALLASLRKKYTVELTRYTI